MQWRPYDREAAVAYAHRYAFDRNPAYYDFSGLGGDCTNYASQCVYAGAKQMNFTKTMGWFYKTSRGCQKTPSGIIKGSQPLDFK